MGTGQSTALIEGINTRKSNNHAEGDYDYITLEEMQIAPTGGNAQTLLSNPPPRLGYDRQRQNPADRQTIAAFDLLTLPTAIQQRTFDLLGVPLRLT